MAVYWVRLTLCLWGKARNTHLFVTPPVEVWRGSVQNIISFYYYFGYFFQWFHYSRVCHAADSWKVENVNVIKISTLIIIVIMCYTVDWSSILCIEFVWKTPSYSWIIVIFWLNQSWNKIETTWYDWTDHWVEFLHWNALFFRFIHPETDQYYSSVLYEPKKHYLIQHNEVIQAERKILFESKNLNSFLFASLSWWSHPEQFCCGFLISAWMRRGLWIFGLSEALFFFLFTVHLCIVHRPSASLRYLDLKWSNRLHVTISILSKCLNFNGNKDGLKDQTYSVSVISIWSYPKYHYKMFLFLLKNVQLHRMHYLSPLRSLQQKLIHKNVDNFHRSSLPISTWKHSFRPMNMIALSPKGSFGWFQSWRPDI